MKNPTVWVVSTETNHPIGIYYTPEDARVNAQKYDEKYGASLAQVQSFEMKPPT